MGEIWKFLAEQSFREESVRADYVHEDRYASLGLAALQRGPLAFLPREERAAVAGLDPDSWMLAALPDSKRIC